MGVRNNLLTIRLHMGYKNQKDFAELLGIGQSNYNLIENNKKQVTIEQALKISKKINMGIEEIFELVE